MKPKDKKFLIVLAIEAVILLAAVIVGVTKERETLYFGDAYNEPVPLYGSEIELKRGSYSGYIAYQTDLDGGSCQIVVETDFGTFSYDEIPLISAMSERKFELMSKYNTESFYLGINGADDAQLEVTALILEENGDMDRAFCFALAGIFLLIDLLICLKKKKVWANLSDEQKNVCIGLVVITLLAVVPIMTNYVTKGHDNRFHLMRIEGIAEALRSGQFPVRMHPIWLNDHGYPVSVMYGDLFLYIPALLRLMGFTLQAAYKTYIVLATAAAAGVSYYCMKHTAQSAKLGLLGSFLYTLSFYRITNVYARNAVGEYTAMIFFPLVFFALYRLFHTEEKKERRKYAVMLMIAYTGILQSHLLSFEMIIVLSVIYCLLNGRVFLKNIVSLVKLGVITILINLSYLLPLADYLITHHMTLTEESEMMQAHGIFPAQLFQTFSFGAYLSESVEKGISNDMPLGIGIAFLITLIVFLWQLIVYKQQLRETMQETVWKEQCIHCILMILSIWMACWFFPWGVLERLGSFLAPYQYPWRFLVMATVFGTFLSVSVVVNIKNTKGETAKNIVILLLCVFTGINAISQYDRIFVNYPAYRMTSYGAFNHFDAVAGGEYMLDGANRYDAMDDSVMTDESVNIYEYEKEGLVIRLDLENTSAQNQGIIVPFYAYKGFRATDQATGEKLDTFVNEEDQKMGILLPANYAGQITVRFQEPLLWRFAELIALASLIGFIYLYRRSADRSTGRTAEKSAKMPQEKAKKTEKNKK